MGLVHVGVKCSLPGALNFLKVLSDDKNGTNIKPWESKIKCVANLCQKLRCWSCVSSTLKLSSGPCQSSTGSSAVTVSVIGVKR